VSVLSAGTEILDAVVGWLAKTDASRAFTAMSAFLAGFFLAQT